ncbi:hypothetical protein BpHYR1_033794 [Brachionus plicatilis]|uniref:Uncharacterized protein n=1 Tax=Brachionus plicatilis TaxID=10195 RepID=A0A3M7Q8L5_BRAPC|nr:hypothetical protein BpHYR1_033794 [Brachionus plicatilis]
MTGAKRIKYLFWLILKQQASKFLSPDLIFKCEESVLILPKSPALIPITMVCNELKNYIRKQNIENGEDSMKETSKKD